MGLGAAFAPPYTLPAQLQSPQLSTHAAFLEAQIRWLEAQLAMLPPISAADAQPTHPVPPPSGAPPEAGASHHENGRESHGSHPSAEAIRRRRLQRLESPHSESPHPPASD